MELFIYLLKSMGILVLFYLVYLVALRSDTYFESNRHFLLAGILAAVILPFVTFTQLTIIEISTGLSEAIPAATGEIVAQQQPLVTTVNWLLVALVAYCLIMSILIMRLGIQFVSLLRILKSGTQTKCNGYTLVESTREIAPFSFFKYIVYNPGSHDIDELAMVLKHEQVHVKQRHSLDLLIANLLTVLQWVNPFAWWYKSMMAENLEFIADRLTVANIPCEKQYQLALVKNAANTQNFTITNHFHQSFNHLNILGLRIKMPFQNGRIKKRIVMLNKSKSNKQSKWKLAIILPLLGMFMWSFNVKEVTEYATAAAVSHTITSQSSDAQLDAIQESLQSESHIKVRFKDRKRDSNNELTSLSVNASYNASKPLYKYLTLDGKQKGPIGSMMLDVVNGELRISDPESKMVMRATKKGLVADALDVTPKIAQKKELFFGDNPLYIINEKPFKAEDLPKDKTLVTAGKITALDKEEGQKKYGDAGKDGVLEVTGLTTFKDKPVVENSPTAVQNRKIKAIKDIVVVINKDMSKGDLDKKSAELKKSYDIDLTIEDVTYNSNNEIIAIELRYRKGDSNGSYGVHSDDGPIDDIFLTINDDGGIGIGNDRARIDKERNLGMVKARAARMEGRNQETKARVAVRKQEMENRKKEMKTASRARQKDIKTRSKDLKDKQKALAVKERNLAYSYGNLRDNYASVAGSGDRVVVKASFTDGELEVLKEKLAAKGVDFTYKKVKRNSDGLITSIKLTLKNNNGSSTSTNITSDNDQPIDPIVMEY